MDETYIKVKGKWIYYYRAVDANGHTIDCFLSKTRDQKTAYTFFTQAIGHHGRPDKVNMDKCGVNFAAINAINKKLDVSEKITVYQVKYLNNLIEQDHRFVKKITKPIMGFKSFESAEATLIGIDLYHAMRKGQYSINTNQPIWKRFYELAA